MTYILSRYSSHYNELHVSNYFDIHVSNLNNEILFVGDERKDYIGYGNELYFHWRF